MMEWLAFEDVHWGAVALAFVVSFGLGALWYSPMLFYPVWSRLEGLTEEKAKSANMAVAFGGTALSTLAGVVLLALLMVATGASGIGAGALMGAILGLVFRGGAHFIHNGFAARDPRVSLIDTAHDTVTLAIAGAILGIWI